MPFPSALAQPSCFFWFISFFLFFLLVFFFLLLLLLFFYFFLFFFLFLFLFVFLFVFVFPLLFLFFFVFFFVIISLFYYYSLSLSSLYILFRYFSSCLVYLLFFPTHLFFSLPLSLSPPSISLPLSLLLSPLSVSHFHSPSLVLFFRSTFLFSLLSYRFFFLSLFPHSLTLLFLSLQFNVINRIVKIDDNVLSITFRGNLVTQICIIKLI